MSATIRYLNWNRPILDLAVERLTADWNAGVLDLSDILVVVPTTQSGRRLRKALAEFTNIKATGLLPPRTVTPEFLFRPSPAGSIATQAQSTAAWVRVLLSIDINKYRDLFPAVEDATDNVRWALDIGARLAQLRSELSEAGLDIAEVHRRASVVVEDRHRWENLARLENQYRKALECVGLSDRNDQERLRAHKPIVPPDVKRIIVAAVPDPMPLAVSALDVLAKSFDIEIWIHAPKDLAGHFDSWGRPVAEKWEKVDIPFDSESIRLCGNPNDLAGELRNCLASHGPEIKAADVAIGSLNDQAVPFIEKAFEEIHTPVYDPSGMALAKHGMFLALRDWHALASSREYASFADLVRNPDVLYRLKHDYTDFSIVHLLTQLDEFHNTHLPDTIDSAHRFLGDHPEDRFTELRIALATVQKRIKESSELSAPAFMQTFMSWLYKGVSVFRSDSGEIGSADVATGIVSVIEELNSLSMELLDLDRDAVARIILDAASRRHLYPDHSHKALALQGWLELHWDPAPILAIAGMNEGFVPESIVGDLFLPDVPRAGLGLKDNKKRLARDMYLMNAMIHSRPEGATYCLVGKTDANGDPLKPSRLLFRCPDEQLPERVSLLFADRTVPRAQPSNEGPQWLLNVRRAPPPDRLAITGFRNYLTCPFRFYLSNVFGMAHLDDTKTEADALDFGIVCHHALEQLGPGGDLVHSIDPVKIAHMLRDRAERYMKSRFGGNLNLGLTVQLETIKQRLAAAAKAEVAQREQGWQTLLTEYSLGQEQVARIGTMRVTGKIDRIDTRDDVIRILDYKTSDSSSSPAQAHLRPPQDNDPQWARCLIDGKVRTWVDLQLPLYAILLSTDPQFEGKKIECGYFNLPKATSDTGVVVWEELTPEVLEQANACAQAIVKQITEGVFWPPTDRVAYDDFEDLYVDSLCKSVASFPLPSPGSGVGAQGRGSIVTPRI